MLSGSTETVQIDLSDEIDESLGAVTNFLLNLAGNLDLSDG